MNPGDEVDGCDLRLHFVSSALQLFLATWVEDWSQAVTFPALWPALLLMLLGEAQIVHSVDLTMEAWILTRLTHGQSEHRERIQLVSKPCRPTLNKPTE